MKTIQMEDDEFYAVLYVLRRAGMVMNLFSSAGQAAFRLLYKLERME